MDMITKGTLIRTCLAVLFAAGFMIFLAPVFTGIINIGNVAGMTVCTILFFTVLFLNRIIPFVTTYKALKTASVILIVVAITLIIAASVISVLMIFSANSPPPANTTVIVLGCKVRGEKPSLMLNKRIMAAYEYLSENPEAMCIVSGGQGSDELISEAECMKRVLVENGISETRIIMENCSASTDENICYSLEKMKEHGLSGDAVIVTSEFHQLRAKLIAEKYDLKTYSVSAQTAWYLLPTYWLREWFGVTYEFFFG